ncbi:MAG: 3-dehydroquinate synthase [Hyphomonadaceae bacterium]|nr:3-dehydroquinate synthase [Hyphomonadaceae bacterium]
MDADTLTEPTQVRVELGDRSYDILIGADLLAQASAHISPFLKQDRVFIVSDETVWRLHGDALNATFSKAGLSVIEKILPAGESTKSWTLLGETLDWLLEHGASRDDVLIAFGGGVIGDLTGFAASMLKRGMQFIQIPTTLLAQVDSSVGGKTAVNARHGKNLIGAFYQPRLVLADTSVLATLPDRERRAGYAEIIKYGLINDRAFIDWLSQHGRDVLDLVPNAIAEAVAVSCRSKAQIVAQDEQEGGVRAVLNLGHTFGHALEAENGYGPDLLHGEAVGTGMVLALRYSARLGLMPESEAERGANLIAQSGLTANLGALPGGPYDSAALVEAMRQDKKARGGKVPLILAKGLGEAFIYPNADLSDVQDFLQEELQKS